MDITERDLRAVFGKWGVVEDVVIGSARDGNALEQAVRGMSSDTGEDDNDDEDDVGAGQVESESTGTTQEPRFQGVDPPLSRAKRRKVKPQLPPSIPEIIPPPPLNPRSTPFGLSGATSAHITYLDSISITRAMSFTGSITIPEYGDSEPTGLEYYTRLHTSLRPSLSAVRAFADSSMARFDHLHGLLLSSRAKKLGAGALVDEDGFTVVVRGGKYGRTGGSGIMGVGVAKKEEGGKKKVGKGAGELTDFYRFQKVDRKRQGKSSEWGGGDVLTGV